MLSRSRFRQTVVTAQNLGDRARRREVGLAAILKSPPDLSPAPNIVAAIAQREHLGFHGRRRSPRTGLRPPRLLDQPRQPPFPVALEQLVSGCRTDPETPAKLANVRPVGRRKHDKLPFPIHHRHLAKLASPPSRSADRKSVHDVSERVSSMSPVYTSSPTRGEENGAAISAQSQKQQALLGNGQRRLLAGAGVSEPLFPFGGVVGPFLQARCTNAAAPGAGRRPCAEGV